MYTVSSNSVALCLTPHPTGYPALPAAALKIALGEAFPSLTLLASELLKNSA
jgi:hypothetical protein